MDAFVIRGGRRLKGAVRVSGSKNASLPLMAAAILADGPVTLRDVPVLSDITNMEHLLGELGVKVTRDPDKTVKLEVVDEMNSDPLIAHEKQPAETLSEVLKAAARIGENMPKIKVPVFIIHGTDDKATRWQGSQYFYDNVGSTDKTLKLYEGGYHDLLNDIEKETVMADILAWVNERVPAQTAASA